MSNRVHVDFIKTSILSVLEEGLSAIKNVGNGIEAFPVYEYFLQSVFIKMTGFLEQKCKCICWELATDDFEYRYEHFSKKTIGECSSYDDKNAVYKDLLKQIKKSKEDFEVSDKQKKEILDKAKNVENLLKDSSVMFFCESDFADFVEWIKKISVQHFLKKALFENMPLTDEYENNLYRHRNRIAHNTLSYQQNLPDLKKLADKKCKKPNYFIFFFILALIDEIFINLWIEYESAISNF